MTPTLLVSLLQWGIPELIKLIPTAAIEIRKLLDQGDAADWTALDKYKVDFKTAFPHADIS